MTQKVTDPQPDIAPPTDETGLVRCDNCGRYGWHTTDRCPEPAQINPYPGIPLPAGAVQAEGWCDVGKPEAFRLFTGPRHYVAGYFVETFGSQQVDGSIEEVWIRTNLHPDDEISSDASRRLASAFLAVADELDGLDR
jgi:hypothetical protein